jgi:hypothetical protein
MLEELKVMLGIAADDTDRDDLLQLIICSVAARLRVLLGGMEPPENLFYIIREVSIIRFNKIGSEGMESHTVEGESQHFSDNDFAGFMDDIEAFLNAQGSGMRGKLRFL